MSLKNDPPEKLLKSKGLFKPSGNRYRYDTLGTNRHIWVSHLGNGALEKLRNAMESGNTTPLQFRNRNIHGLLSASQMNEGKKAFGCSGIWSEFPQKTGDYFIGNPMIRPILQSLGVSKPGSLYCDLLEEIEKKLLEHKCQ